MKRTRWFRLFAVAALLAGGLIYYRGALGQQQPESPKHPTVPTDGKELVVQLCDGETYTRVKGVRPDERLSPEQAQAVSNELMTKWMAKVDPAAAAVWKKEISAAMTQQSKAAGQKKTAPKSGAAGQSSAQSAQASDFTSRDEAVWKRELDRQIQYGNEIFHSDKLIASTNGIACAMCHPNGSNTHAETYPKFQVQLRRVALLRDMINWCIENPARGKKLEADDPKMRALEAYIMSQRKGVPMEYGKH